MTSDLPTLYRACTDCRGQGIIEISDTDGIQCERCSYSPTVMPVTEPLLTREEAANDPRVQEMIAQFILKASGWDDR